MSAAPCRRVVISGCSGGGKSTLIAELARRGHAVAAEPGRRILAEDRAGGGLPWADTATFGRRALAMSVADHRMATGPTFFDRGVVDAAVAIAAGGGDWPDAAIAEHRYDRLFLAPPWPAIYANDADRRHSFDAAVRDYDRMRNAYLRAGYDPVLRPRASVAARADFVLARSCVSKGAAP